MFKYTLDNKRYNTICLNQKFTKKIGSQIKVSKTNNKNQIYKSFRGKAKLNNLKSSSNVRSNSITSAFNPKRGPYLALHKSPKSNTKIRIDLSKDEIYNFASMNYHVEINENLLRMIAVSVSINECRLYDDLDIYKEYYKSTIPWKNKNFYTEKTQNKKYNDNNLPSWLSIKNDKRFTNIEFKIICNNKYDLLPSLFEFKLVLLFSLSTNSLSFIIASFFEGKQHDYINNLIFL